MNIVAYLEWLMQDFNLTEEEAKELAKISYLIKEEE